jgi:hypothetical protein
MNFINLTADFTFVNTTTTANGVISIRTDVLEVLTAQQLVTIAKSINPEIKVNTKQSKQVTVNVIMSELENVEVVDTNVEVKTDFEFVPKQASTKTVCYNEFGKIDMDDKVAVRALVGTLVESLGLKKRVVQSYVSNYRRAIKEAQS